MFYNISCFYYQMQRFWFPHAAENGSFILLMYSNVMNFCSQSCKISSPQINRRPCFQPVIILLMKMIRRHNHMWISLEFRGKFSKRNQTILYSNFYFAALPSMPTGTHNDAKCFLQTTQYQFLVNLAGSSIGPTLLEPTNVCLSPACNAAGKCKSCREGKKCAFTFTEPQ